MGNSGASPGGRSGAGHRQSLWRGQTVTSGIISALGRNQLASTRSRTSSRRTPPSIQATPAVHWSTSGQPAGHQHRHLLPVWRKHGHWFAIPTSIAQQVLEGIVRDGSITRGWIGVEPNDLSAELAETFRCEDPRRHHYWRVAKRPRSQGGISVPGRDCRIADQPVADVSQLLARVALIEAWCRCDSPWNGGVSRWNWKWFQAFDKTRPRPTAKTERGRPKTPMAPYLLAPGCGG